MIAYDGYLKRLPLDPLTVMRGMASIDEHPDRNHNHKPYVIINCEDILEIQEKIQLTCAPQQKHSIDNKDNISALNDIVLPSVWIPQKRVDQNCPYSMLRAIPMTANGAKQPFQLWFSLLCAFSRTGIAFDTF